MADVHPGYGFPIGGVGAFDPAEGGVVTVAGVGFDVNCGVRTLRTPLVAADVEAQKEELADALFRTVPAGVGSTGELRLSLPEVDEVLVRGAEFAVERGYGRPEDLVFVEEGGRMAGADPGAVSKTARERQHRQVGTLGSGNHYLEVQVVDSIFDAAAAAAYGLAEGQVVISIHTGSRALGHQIGTDYLKVLEQASKKYGIPIRERELVGAPIESPEGRRYLSAVSAGMNCAFANRQVLGALARRALRRVFGLAEERIEVLYEVAHNNVKFEDHEVEGRRRRLLVHRKGATRAFGPGHPDVPEAYRAVGQPVLVGGTMGTASWILAGTATAMQQTFGSACHGAGRHLSRQQSLKKWRGEQVVRELESRGILIRAPSMRGVAEEAPGAYKDVDVVVDSMERAGVSRKVARLRPLVCVKG
jgi:tRNA-splicing ligase RtcB